MSFTQDWTTQNAVPNFQKFLMGYKDQPVRFLEIGCFEGRATLWLLENVLTHEKAKIDVIDTFEGSHDHKKDGIELVGMYDRFCENVRAHDRKVLAYPGDSHCVLRKFRTPEEYDFIYVDGSHLSVDAIEDIVLAWPLLKTGGTMIMDDYANNAFADPGAACRAINSFLSCYEGHYELLEKGYQVVVKKI